MTTELILGVKPGDVVHVNGVGGLEFSGWTLLHAAFLTDGGLPTAVASLTLRHEGETVTLPWHAVLTIQRYDTIPLLPTRSKILTSELTDEEWERG